MKKTNNIGKLLKAGVVTVVLFVLIMPNYILVTKGCSSPSPPSTVDWTVMVYCPGDNDLYNYLLNDIDDMETIGSTQHMNVLALSDGPENGDSRLFHIDYDTDPTRIISSQPDLLHQVIPSDYEVDSGSKNTLNTFINWVEINYPADRYLLIIDDHGEGWQGCCQDFSSHSEIEITDLPAAIGHVDVLYFACCLMSQTEVLYQLGSSADIIVGHEGVADANGNNFHSILSYISSGSDDPVGLASTIVWSYDGGSVDGIPNVIAAFKTNHIDDLASDIETLAQEILKDEDNFENVYDAVSHGVQLGYWYYDLGNLATQIKEYTVDNPTLKDDAQDIIDLLDNNDFYITSKVISAPSSMWGLSIYCTVNPISSYSSEYEGTDFARFVTSWCDLQKTGLTPAIDCLGLSIFERQPNEITLDVTKHEDITIPSGYFAEIGYSTQPFDTSNMLLWWNNNVLPDNTITLSPASMGGTHDHYYVITHDINSQSTYYICLRQNAPGDPCDYSAQQITIPYPEFGITTRYLFCGTHSPGWTGHKYFFIYDLSGLGELTFTLSESIPWVSAITPSSGSSRGDWFLIDVTIGNTGVMSGYYTEYITINSNCGNFQLPIDITIVHGPLISAYPSPILFATILNFNTSSAFIITNIGDQTLSYSIQKDSLNCVTSYYPKSGQLAAGQQVTIRYTVLSYTVGEFEGHFVITGNTPTFYLHVMISIDNPSQYGPPGGGYECFLKGTLISLSDGSKKPIEQVKIGDTVVAYNDVRHCQEQAKVIKVFQHDPKENSFYYLRINGNLLEVTPNHPLYINGRWTAAGRARLGDHLLSIDGSTVHIISIEKSHHCVPVYNLEVEQFHDYYANGMLVHNKAPHWVKQFMP
jgi:hypothetical protein